MANKCEIEHPTNGIIVKPKFTDFNSSMLAELTRSIIENSFRIRSLKKKLLKFSRFIMGDPTHKIIQFIKVLISKRYILGTYLLLQV